MCCCCFCCFCWIDGLISLSLSLAVCFCIRFCQWFYVCVCVCLYGCVCMCEWVYYDNGGKYENVGIVQYRDTDSVIILWLYNILFCSSFAALDIRSFALAYFLLSIFVLGDSRFVQSAIHFNGSHKIHTWTPHRLIYTSCSRIEHSISLPSIDTSTLFNCSSSSFVFSLVLRFALRCRCVAENFQDGFCQTLINIYSIRRTSAVSAVVAILHTVFFLSFRFFRSAVSPSVENQLDKCSWAKQRNDE